MQLSLSEASRCRVISESRRGRAAGCQERSDRVFGTLNDGVGAEYRCTAARDGEGEHEGRQGEGRSTVTEDTRRPPSDRGREATKEEASGVNNE